MVESAEQHLQRKMKEIQDLIQEADNAKALGMPAILDGFNQQAGGAFIEIKIIINEAKLNEFRAIRKGGR